MASGLTPLPVHGDVFFDARDGERTCRVSWHPDLGVFVLSVWRRGVCVVTFQLARHDVAGFLGAFVRELSDRPVAEASERNTG